METFEEFNLSNILNKKRKFHKLNENKVVGKSIVFDACERFGLDSSKIKYIGSGSFGDAYKIGDKVLKITTDKREIRDVISIINKNRNGIVKYHKFWKFDENTYCILMDYVTTLSKLNFEKNYKNLVYVNDIIDILYRNWGKINYEQYKELIEKEYDVIKRTWHYSFALKIFRLYRKLLQTNTDIDFHVHNIGVDKNGEFVIFDFNTLKKVKK